MISAGLLFGALVATGRGFLLTAEVVLAAHAPVAAAEALVGGLCTRYLYAVRPEMLAWKTEIQR